MLAPIIIFVYNRVDRVKKLIESLQENEEAKNSMLYIFSDGFKGKKDEAAVNEVRKYVDTLLESKEFSSVSIKQSPENLGLAKSIISGVSEVMEKHNRAIIIEDDNVVAPDFLDYMNRGLEYYHDDPQIWAISGFSREMSFPEDYQHDIFVLQRMSSYAWASWKDRWDKTDWAMNDYPGFLWNHKARRKFDECGEDRSLMMDAQACGKISSWAIRFEYSMVKNNMYSVIPVISRTFCSGNDGSGTHSKKEIHDFDAKLSDGTKRVQFEHVEPDRRIREEFVKPYKQPMYRMFIRNFDKILQYYSRKL